MALSFSPSSPFPIIPSPKSTHQNLTFQITSQPTSIFTSKLSHSTPKTYRLTLISKASSQEQENTVSESETQQNPSEPTRPDKDEDVKISELGMEIKKAMKEREEKETDFLGGVAEEIREIEWPAFGKVLGTTGVVLGVIAGSSVVLLTVNAVLAELSDRVFAGKGVQDLFG